MKKFLFLGFFVLSSTGLSAQQDGQSKHSPIITVQGHPHELLTKLYGGKPYIKPAPKPKLGEIDTGLVRCWSGHLNPAIPSQYVDTAYLIVKWTDGKRALIDEADSVLVWGYVWNSVSLYNNPVTGQVDTFPVTVHSIDMLRAVANSDCRLLVLLQQTGVNGYTVGGIGYNYTVIPIDSCEQCRRVPVHFDLAGADTTVTSFHYKGTPNCNVGQTAVPFLPDSQAVWAIRAATPNTLAYATGIIEHPFNVNYGYPAYDYDHWQLIDSIAAANPDYEWQAGWLSGNWTFFTDTARQIPTTPSENEGVTTHVLVNNSVDGFVFTPPVWPPAGDFSGQLFPALCPCNPCPAPNKYVRKPIK
jgi:hypothetical protein